MNDATLHIRLEESLKSELEQYANKFSMKLSGVIRLALEDFAYNNSSTEPSTSKINIDNF